LHPDHTLGIPAFIISNWVKGRTELQIYGPKGVRKIAYGALDIYAEGIAEHQRSGANHLGEIIMEVTDMHTSSRALGAIASEAQPKLLVLTHQMMFSGTEPADVIGEIREAGFMGDVVYANDMDVFE
jgi:ribonuclease BN (tRNA processing enzyme)